VLAKMRGIVSSRSSQEVLMSTELSNAMRFVEEEALETVTIRVELGRATFERLTRESVACSELWLTEQADGSYALGVV
jgi:hypothetical protein